ncbi:MAG TPA: hypothetical protein VEY67_00955, partial [Candidatus Dormibacteraeota bacterium]|nr:hypothetical protein [Candidatus Dormibacteraeota bacterium]
PASFAWTRDGTRHVGDLAATGSFTLTLTADQRRTLRLEPVVGQMSVTSSWLAPARPGVRPADPDVRIVRSVLPGLTVGQDEMVRVRITATFAGTATDGCYEITERVPSGLAPLPVPDQSEFGTSDRSKTVITPFAVAGQLVSFCASPGMPKLEAVYSARVVSPGTYTWEPASVASSAGGERVSLTDAATLTIE